jgi:glutaredoxin
MAMFKVFRKKDCPQCVRLSGVLESFKDVKELEVFDIESPEGLAQAMFYDVWSTPTLVYQLAKEENPRTVMSADDILEILSQVKVGK